MGSGLTALSLRYVWNFIKENLHGDRRSESIKNSVRYSLTCLFLKTAWFLNRHVWHQFFLTYLSTTRQVRQFDMRTTQINVNTINRFSLIIHKTTLTREQIMELWFSGGSESMHFHPVDPLRRSVRRCIFILWLYKLTFYTNSGVFV